jgi:DNA binding protein with HTH domain
MAERQPLEVKSRNDLLTAAEINGAALSVADCQSLDRERMAMTLEITGTPEAVEGTIATLRTMIGVEQAFEVPTNSQRTRIFMTLQKPRVCRASDDNALMCLDCPFDAAEVPLRWRVAPRYAGDAKQVIAKEGDEGFVARVEDISATDKSVVLSRKERGIVAVAIERGYFDFPRRITLQDLSQLVGVDPAMLRELFRILE